MKPHLSVFAFLLISACGVKADKTTEAPTHKTSPSSPQLNPVDYKSELTNFYCGDAPNCIARDISNASLEYGGWLAQRLDSPVLEKSTSRDVTMSEIGPNKAGDYIQLGVVRYEIKDKADVLNTLTNRPDQVFADGKVLMQYRVLDEADSLVILFGGTFDEKIDSFLKQY